MNNPKKKTEHFQEVLEGSGITAFKKRQRHFRRTSFSDNLQ